jgi:hypothetical protein
MEQYKPVSLPPLPRATCPYLVYEARRKHCGKPTDASGFCPEHSYCHDILNKLHGIGCPALEINKYLRIGRGVETWEQYVITLPPPSDKGRMIDGFFCKGRYYQLLEVIEAYRADMFPPVGTLLRKYSGEQQNAAAQRQAKKYRSA